MRLSELDRAFADVFGESRGASLKHDLVLAELGVRTPAQALSDGEDPQAIWRAVWREMDLAAELEFPHRRGRQR